MFEIGDYVVYGQNGICQITDLTRLNMSGIDRKKKYYVLNPIKDKSGVIYSPVDNTKVVLRHILTRDEALELIDGIPDIEELWIQNERMREEEYKEAMKACDCRQWIRIIKTLYVRREERIAAGKKVTSTDERYYKQASSNLYAELGMAMDIDEEHVEKIIFERIESKSR